MSRNQHGFTFVELAIASNCSVQVTINACLNHITVAPRFTFTQAS